MKILMCRPDYYGIYYEINPWMHIDKPAEVSLAKSQWQGLYQTILAAGAKVELIEPVEGLPDMVFTANAGLKHQEKIWIANFRSPERQSESEHFKAWFQAKGFKLANLSTDFSKPPYFEGAGDALFLGEKLIAGFGLRSQLEAYEAPFFQDFSLVLCELIAVNEEEAKHFACNAVVIDKQVIIPSGCPELSSALEARGFTVYACDMSEYIKAGGACKCLTLRL